MGSCWCERCKTGFANIESLRQHLITDLNHHYCDACDKEFSSIMLLERHRNEVHKASGERCNKCKATFYNQQALRQHLIEDKRHNYCQQCQIDFDSAIALKLHGHAQECNRCNRKFASADALAAHIKDSPAHVSNFESRLSFSHSSKKLSSSSVHQHCRICSEQYRTTEELNFHNAMVHNHGEQWCDFCKKAFGTSRGIKKHQKICSATKPSAMAIDKKHFEDNHARSLCGICTFGAPNPAHLAKHVLEAHKNNAVRCERCNMSFSSKEGLKEHLKVDAAHHYCNDCSADFPTLQKLESHAVRIHNKGREWCKTCCKAFVNKQAFHNHLSLTSPPHFYCKDCDIDFPTPEHFQNHREELHTRKMAEKHAGERRGITTAFEGTVRVSQNVDSSPNNMREPLNEPTRNNNRIDQTGEGLECFLCGQQFANKAQELDHYHEKHFNLDGSFIHEEDIAIDSEENDTGFQKWASLQRAHQNNLQYQ